jgi:hypothetical protein
MRIFAARDNAPSSVTPVTYFLTVRFKNQFPAIFAVDIGANGAPGPCGLPGASGSPGVARALLCMAVHLNRQAARRPSAAPSIK